MPTQNTDVVRYIPPSGTFFRDQSATKDQQYKNCFRETVSNPQNNTAIAYVIKREGTSTLASIGTTGVARGCYYWDKTDKIYAIRGNKVYHMTTAGASVTELITLANSTGKIGFVEYIGLVSYLVLSDGVKLYLINTSNVVTTLSVDQVMRITVTNGGSAGVGLVLTGQYLLLRARL